MKVRIFCFYLSVLMSFAASGNEIPVGFVEKLRGQVTLSGKVLKVGDEIREGGVLKTASKSFIKLVIKKWNGQIVLGPNAQMKVDWSEMEETGKYSLLSGACRWKSLKGTKASGGVSGRVAAFGVRGTDFFLKSNALLNETEVVVFEGKVEMTNLLDKADKVEVGKGQWGGVGGRYGKRIGPIIDLPEEALAHFNRFLR